LKQLPENKYFCQNDKKTTAKVKATKLQLDASEKAYYVAVVV